MLIYVPLDQIDDNPFQARTEYGAIDELASRIAAAKNSYPDSFGLMQIPRGRLVIQNARYDNAPVDKIQNFEHMFESGEWDPALRLQLAFGHRRLRAFRHLHENSANGYTDGRFPVHVDVLSDDQMLDAVWSENCERKDISAVEEAELLARKLKRAKEAGGNQSTVAEAWGLARTTVTNRLRLLQLPEEVQAANRNGRLSERHCLALLSVVRISEAVNGTVKWSKKYTTDYWSDPTAPDVFIAHVATSGKVTSDDIRNYTKRAAAHAGHHLPDQIARHTFELVSPMRQAQCKRCPARFDTQCLDETCRDAKIDAFVAYHLATAAADLGYPISEQPADFEPFSSYQDDAARATLRALHESDADDANIVIGWKLSGYALRPYHHDAFAAKSYSKSAIILGYRGTLPGSETAATAVEDIPDNGTIAVWEAAARKQLSSAVDKAQAAVLEAVILSLADTDMIQVLLYASNQTWIDEPEKVAKRLADLMWEQGHWNQGAISHASQGYEKVAAMLDRAGIGRKALCSDGDAHDLHDEAIRVLAYWYDRRGASWDDDAPGIAHRQLTSLNLRLEDARSWGDPELATLAYEVGRALRDVTSRLEQHDDND